MQLIDTEQEFNDLFRTFNKRAFHLETQDTLTLPDEAPYVAKFLAGETIDWADWCEPWNSLMDDVTESGRLVQRARIVTEPLTDYSRFLHADTPDNIAHGEYVRWLPRHLADPADAALRDDFWLFDDTTVADITFRSDGTYGGTAVTTDPAIVAHYVFVYQRVWAAAIPHTTYMQ